MKTVAMERAFDYRPHRMLSIHFEAGTTYLRVIEAAAAAIVAAGAGRVVVASSLVHATGPTADARDVWKRRG